MDRLGMLKEDYRIKEKDLIDKILALKPQIGMWDIAFNESTMADFVVSYMYNEQTNEYEVYINIERGRHRVRRITSDEIEALEKLYLMVLFETESNRQR